MNKIFRTGVVYVFWKKTDGLLRIDVEFRIIGYDNYLLGHEPYARRAHNIKSEGETKRMRDSYHGRITHGTRNTVRNR